LGIFFTVKLAIDKQLINDAGKILIGLLSGTILIAVAHRLSKNYRAFSSILAGGGIAVLYFSIYQAFQSYHLLLQSSAFFAMILVTILAVILSVFYDKKELAIIAIIGGFCTPFFVSTGEGNYKILFSYMLILNIGMFCLAYFKKWNLVNIICYAFTILIFGAWMLNTYDVTKGHHYGGFLFATLFYFVFFGMNIINNLKRQTKFEGIDIGILISNSFFYFCTGIYMLQSIQHGQYKGLFTLSLAVFNFAFAFYFYKKKSADKNLIYLLIGLVLTFVSLTAPIQLHGNYITLFWACELILLYWLSVKSNIDLIKNASVVVLILTIGSLIMDWNNNYYHVQINKFPFFFNKAFITGSIVLLALFVKRKMVKLETDTHLMWHLISTNNYVYFLEILMAVLVYAVGFLELNYQTNHTYRLPQFTSTILWLYQYMFVAGLLLYSKYKKPISVQRIIVLIASALSIIYIIANQSISSFRDMHIVSHNTSMLYLWHYLIPLFALFNLYLIASFIHKNYSPKQNIYAVFAWFLTIAFVYIISCEAIHIWVTLNYEKGFALYDCKAKATKILLPILWSLTSLGLMVVGMRRKIKLLRIISLSLFSLTILKLFTYDISNASQAGKIAAFVILGIILLLVSFLYQRIKGLFTDEEENTTHTNTHL
jgi:uncharacterized membrane protein